MPRAKRIAGTSGVPSPLVHGEGQCRRRCSGRNDDRTPRGQRGRHVRMECAVKARNHSRVASALPHSEGIAYKPPCGEIAVCLRVGRMGRLSDDGPGHYNPVPSEDPWGGGVITLQGGARWSLRPDSVRDNRRDSQMHEGRMQTGRRTANAGSRLKPLRDPGRHCLESQPSSRTGENPPYVAPG